MIPFKFEVNVDNTDWVLFSEVLEIAGLGDPKTANEKCRIEPAIEVGPLPGGDQRQKYIRKSDIPRLFERYTRLNPAQTEAIARITGSTSPDNPPGNSPENPDNAPAKSRGEKPKAPDNIRQKAPVNFEECWWNRWGNILGNIYRSPLVAYSAFTCMVIALACLHTTAAWRLLPGLPWWDMPVLAFLMQSIILVGTFNAHHFFKETRYYFLFLGGFALYDLVMSACNFFQGYDPTLLAGYGVQLVTAIIDLAIRIGLSLGFTIGTLFFALLVKKIKTN